LKDAFPFGDFFLRLDEMPLDQCVVVVGVLRVGGLVAEQSALAQLEREVVVVNITPLDVGDQSQFANEDVGLVDLLVRFLGTLLLLVLELVNDLLGLYGHFLKNKKM
jgi:hypothetical protein